MKKADSSKDCTFSIFSENSPGVLHRITTLFTRRKINIESLTVSHTEVEGISRFTIVVCLPLELADKIARQLRRIIEVMEVQLSDNKDLIYKEIAFFRVAAPNDKARQQIAHHVLRHGAAIVSIDPEALVIEKTGSEEEIQQLFASFGNVAVKEFVRSGRIAMRRQKIEAHEVTSTYLPEAVENLKQIPFTEELNKESLSSLA